MKYLKYFLVSLLAISLLFLVASCSKEEEKVEERTKNEYGYYVINQDEAKAMMDNGNVVIVDVREDFEYKEGHIDNSVLLPLGEVETTAETVLPNKEETILVYCWSGNRSKQASNILTSLGYTNIYEFGGISTWEYGIVK